MESGYLACGTIAAARDQDEAAALDRELALRQSLGLPVERLLATDARRLEPSLAPVLRLALEVPDDHAIDPRKLCAALAEAAVRSGVELRLGADVASVSIIGDRVDAVRLGSGEELRCEQLVVAAGVWSGALAGIPDELRVPIRPVKGQIMRLRDPAGAGLLTRALRMQGSGYIVPRGDGGYVLGATMEERGFDTTVTAGPLFELLRDAIEMVPGVSELVVEELIAGLRPSTPDNAPAIGPGAIGGLVWATGHHRHGILLAPITADVVAGVLAGEEIPDLAAAFTPMRFAGAGVGSAA